MLAGEALGAFALTEPHAGCDAAAIRTRAERGRAGRRARRLPADRHEDLDLERARGGPLPRLRDARSRRRARRAITAFLVEKGTAGFRFGAHEKKMGIRACPAAELVFDGAEVPVANRLGAEGEGYKIALSALGEGRISIAAACVGIARAGAGAAARYLRQRKAFGGAAGRAAGPPVHARRDGPGGRRGAGR